MTNPLLPEWLARRRSRVVARGMIVSWLALEEGRGEDQAPGLIALPTQTAVGSGVETAPLVEAVLVSSEAGSGVETSSIGIDVNETGSGVEEVVVLGVWAVSELLMDLRVVEVGSGAEAVAMGIVPDVNGTGSGAETELIGGVLGDSETGSGAETELVTV